jgi:long-chain acyl-CoA synthetase
MAAAVERVNGELAVHERIRRFALAAEPFSIENAQMTPTLKVRRHEVLNRYQATLDSLYGQPV